MAAQGLTSLPPGPLLAVIGPTASGKTALAVELALRLGGEIVSADSRQVYKKLDAATAKPEGRWEELPWGRAFVAGGIAHHLIDFLDPAERIDAGRWAELAGGALASIRARGRRPILAGGTGLYLRALLQGLDPLPKRSPEVREKLAELAEDNGREWLHERLSQVDPAAAARIPPNNLQRVVRALEVYELTGKTISSLWTGGEAAGPRAGARDKPAVLYVGIQWERAALLGRIHERAEAAWPGLLEEVKRLVPAEYKGDEPGFESVGYPQALACVRGEMTERRGLESMIRATADYAKRQATWFRRQATVRWIPAGDGDPAAWADAVLETAAP